MDQNTAQQKVICNSKINKVHVKVSVISGSSWHSVHFSFSLVLIGYWKDGCIRIGDIPSVYTVYAVDRIYCVIYNFVFSQTLHRSLMIHHVCWEDFIPAASVSAPERLILLLARLTPRHRHWLSGIAVENNTQSLWPECVTDEFAVTAFFPESHTGGGWWPLVTHSNQCEDFPSYGLCPIK